MLTDAALEVGARANLVHDSHIVALMRQHGVTIIYTNDSDFHRFAGIDVIDPLSTGGDA